MNDLRCTGRFTAMPELKITSAGKDFCAFSLAVRRPRSKDVTDFINFVAWEGTARFISQYFRKGDMIELGGVLTTRQFTDRSGNKRVAYEVLVDYAGFCGSRNDPSPSFVSGLSDDRSPTDSVPDSLPSFDDNSTEDDLPF